MKYIRSYITAAVLSSIMFAGVPAYAANPPGATDFHQETPLMIIRFNVAHLPYATPLYNTISSALRAKPTAVFDIISIAPRAPTADKQDYFNRLAAQNSHKVLTTLHEIGLPANRISLVDAIDDVSVSEVRIFVH